MDRRTLGSMPLPNLSLFPVKYFETDLRNSNQNKQVCRLWSQQIARKMLAILSSDHVLRDIRYLSTCLWRRHGYVFALLVFCSRRWIPLTKGLLYAGVLLPRITYWINNRVEGDSRLYDVCVMSPRCESSSVPFPVKASFCRVGLCHGQ